MNGFWASYQSINFLFAIFLQGLAFTLEERQVLGIHGLQPARFKSQEEQLELCKISLNRYQEDLNKYLYLIDLQVKYWFLLRFCFMVFYFCLFLVCR